VNALRGVAIALILAGVLALAYGGFSYTRQTQKAQIGPIELSLSETKRVNVPLWAGVAAIVAGGALLVFGGRRS
jgi:TRAP-type C4-dicarboxylate transport system permease small subunit